MSLKVWFPLNGDTKNYGASNIVATNTNAVTNSAGKIGSCYYFKTAILNLPTNTLTSLSTGHDFSFSCWYKANTLASTDDCIFNASKSSTSWNGTVFWFGPKKSNNKLELCTGDANSNYKVGYSSSTITTGVWYHLAFTYSNTVAKIYINGVLDNTITSATAPDYSQITSLKIGGYATSSYSIDGYLNDVRIYDHCLSSGEVNEISKALVLHYPLDSPNNIMRNKYSGDNAKGKCSTGYPTWTRTENYDGSYNYKLTYTGTGNDYWAYLRFPHFTFTVGKRYYYSVKIRCNKCTGGGGLSLRAARSDNDWVTGMVTVCSSTLADGKWHEYYMSTIINSTYDRSGTTVTCDPLMEFYTGSLKTSGTVFEFDFDMKDVQVVESDIYVPFINNGLPQYTVHDCSGYNRNGAVTASTCPIIAGGNPRNRYCYQFDGVDDYILAPVKQGDIFSDKKFTISIWSYLTEFSNYRGIFGPHGTSGTAGICFGQVNTSYIGFTFGDGSSWKGYSDTNYKLNAWVHYAVTYDGTNWIVYRDGAKIGQGSGSIVFDSANITIGRAHSDSNRYWKGKLSDLKVYATALSANDISTMYHNFASIYNSGSLASYDMRENI